MKKLGIIILSFLVLMGVYTPTQAAENDADFCKQFSGKKILWDGVELRVGQIGKLTILQDTQLYKLDGEKKTVSRSLKVGESYRIYAFKPGMLSVGGGYYVDRDSKVEYKTPSKTKLNAVKCNTQPQSTPVMPKEEPAKEDVQNQVQEQHGTITDGMKSAAYFLGLNEGFLVYDIVTQKHEHIPYTLNLVGTHFLAKDALFVHVPNHKLSSSDYNDLYRIELKAPYKMTKVLSRIKNATTDGENLYYTDLITEPTPDGHTIETGTALYKTDLYGNMLNNVFQVEEHYIRMIYKNGYIFAEKFEETLPKVLRISIESGETKILSSAKYKNSSYGNDEQVSFFYWDEIKRQQQMIFDVESQKSFIFEGPYKMMAKVIGNKLYYVSEGNNLYVVENQGKATKILTSTNGAIIAFAGDYLICYDADKDTISKVKFR